MKTGLGVLRKFADFLGDNGKTAARLAGTSGFDGGVQGEKVRLSSDFIDHLHDAVDFLCALRQHIELGGNFVIALNQLREKVALFIYATGNLLDGVLDDLDIVAHLTDGLRDGGHL